MSEKNPLVSFLIPIYNAEQYLTESLISHLYQSYENIEFILVNDGSTDSSREILEEFAKNDSRIKIVNKKNGGIVSALNEGLSVSTGEFIARADADDISFIHRIEKQVAAIKNNDKVVLVASSFEVIDEDSEYMYREIMPTRDIDIKRALYLRNIIAHGSTLMRASTLKKLGGYSADCGPTEDYELWTRLAAEGGFIGIEEPLYRWRQNRNGITFTQNTSMQKFTETIKERYWMEKNPQSISRKDILKTGSYYLSHGNKYGVDMKNVVYDNIAQLSAKLIRSGRALEGIKQLVALSSTGRTGLKYSVRRITTIITTRIKNRG